MPPFECAVHSAKTAACQSSEKILPVKVATESLQKDCQKSNVLQKIRIKEKLNKNVVAVQAFVASCCSTLLVKLDPEVKPI